MRPFVLAFLAEHDLPAWLAPGYGTLAGVAALAAAALVLRRTAREGDDVRGTAAALLWAYAAVLAGGRVDFGKDDQFTVGGSGGWIRSKGWQIAAYFGWTPKGKAK